LWTIAAKNDVVIGKYSKHTITIPETKKKTTNKSSDPEDLEIGPTSIPALLSAPGGRK